MEGKDTSITADSLSCNFTVQSGIQQNNNVTNMNFSNQDLPISQNVSNIDNFLNSKDTEVRKPMEEGLGDTLEPISKTFEVGKNVMERPEQVSSINFVKNENNSSLTVSHNVITNNNNKKFENSYLNHSVNAQEDLTTDISEELIQKNDKLMFMKENPTFYSNDFENKDIIRSASSSFVEREDSILFNQSNEGLLQNFITMSSLKGDSMRTDNLVLKIEKQNDNVKTPAVKSGALRNKNRDFPTLKEANVSFKNAGLAKPGTDIKETFSQDIKSGMQPLSYARIVRKSPSVTLDNNPSTTFNLDEVMGDDNDMPPSPRIFEEEMITEEQLTSEIYQEITNRFNSTIPQNLLHSLKKFSSEKTVIMTVTNMKCQLHKFPLEDFYQLLTEKKLWSYIYGFWFHPNNRYFCVEFHNATQMNIFMKHIRTINGKILCYIDTQRPLIFRGRIRNFFRGFTEVDLQLLLKEFGRVNSLQFIVEEKKYPVPVVLNVANFSITLNKGMKPTDIPTMFLVDNSPIFISLFGVPPQCFHCKQRTHLVSNCPAKYCERCGFKKTKLHSCTKALLENELGDTTLVSNRYEMQAQQIKQSVKLEQHTHKFIQGTNAQRLQTETRCEPELILEKSLLDNSYEATTSKATVEESDVIPIDGTFQISKKNEMQAQQIRKSVGPEEQIHKKGSNSNRLQNDTKNEQEVISMKSRIDDRCIATASKMTFGDSDFFPIEDQSKHLDDYHTEDQSKVLQMTQSVEDAMMEARASNAGTGTTSSSEDSDTPQEMNSTTMKKKKKQNKSRIRKKRQRVDENTKQMNIVGDSTLKSVESQPTKSELAARRPAVPVIKRNNARKIDIPNIEVSNSGHCTRQQTSKQSIHGTLETVLSTGVDIHRRASRKLIQKTESEHSESEMNS